MKVVDSEIKLIPQIDIDYELDNTSSVEDISKAQNSLFKNVLDHIEACNNICYNISIDESLKKHNNFDILEHGTLYLTIPISKPDPDNKEDYMMRMNIVNFYQNNPYSVVKGYKSTEEGVLYVYFITTNYRVIVDNERHNDLIFLFNNSEYHAKRLTYAISCSDHVANEILQRNRFLSISKGPKELVQDTLLVIKPSILEDDGDKTANWIESCKKAKAFYKSLQENSDNPEQFLPNTTRVSLIISCFTDDLEKLYKSIEFSNNSDYKNIINAIIYDKDNAEINEELANEMVKENKKESGEVETIEDSEGEPVIPK